MGDDVDAPHERELFFLFSPSVEKLAKRVTDSNYLANIQGGKACWVLKISEKPVAVIAEEWTSPKFLVAPATNVQLISQERPLNISVDYLAQKDPQTVFLEYSRNEGGVTNN